MTVFPLFVDIVFFEMVNFVALILEKRSDGKYVYTGWGCTMLSVICWAQCITGALLKSDASR